MIVSNIPSMILFNGKITTNDRTMPEAQTVSIADGRIVAIGSDREIDAEAGVTTQRIDLKGRRAIPGLIDSHTHMIRGGLTYNTIWSCVGTGSARSPMRWRC